MGHAGDYWHMKIISQTFPFLAKNLFSLPYLEWVTKFERLKILRQNNYGECDFPRYMSDKEFSSIGLPFARYSVIRIPFVCFLIFEFLHKMLRKYQVFNTFEKGLCQHSWKSFLYHKAKIDRNLTSLIEQLRLWLILTNSYAENIFDTSLPVYIFILQQKQHSQEVFPKNTVFLVNIEPFVSHH